MRRTSLRLALLLPLVAGLGSPSIASDVESANRLFVSAVKAWSQAEALTGGDVADAEARVSLLQEVVTDLGEIIDNHSGSELAVKLVTGETVGPLSFEDAKSSLEAASNDLEMAQCIQEPSHNCVYLAALKANIALDEDKQTGNLAMIAVSLARKGHEQKVDSILEFFRPEDLGVHNLLAIGAGLNRPEMFDEALRVALTEKTEFMRTARINDVIKAQAKAGMIDKAFETAEMFEKVRDYYSSHSDIAAELAKNGQFDKASAIADNIPDLLARSSARQEIAAAYAAEGQADEAFATTVKIEDVFLRSIAFIDVGVVKKDVGQIQASINSAQGLDESLSDLVVERAVEALSELGKVYEATGALAYLKSDTRKHAILAGIARDQVMAGNISEAMKVASMIDDPWQKEWFWMDVAEIEAGFGQLEAAMKSAQAIKDDYRRGLAHCGMAEASAEAGQVKEALQILRKVNSSYTCRPEALGVIAAMLDS